MAIAVSIINDSFTAVEGEVFTQITLLTSQTVPIGELVTIDFEIIPGTATPRADYQYQSPSSVFIRQTGIYADRVSIPGGASISSFVIDILEDTITEGSEYFTINITGVSPNAQIGENSSITVTITDLELSSNLVSITAVADGAEPGSNGQLKVSLSEVAATDTVISYSVSGTATGGSDYIALPGTITIPAGSLSTTIDLTVLDDAYLEGDESVIITLEAIASGDNNLILSEAATATATIFDNPSTVLYRVNAGGPEIVATDGGPNWLTDTPFLLDAGSGNTFNAPSPAESGDTVPDATPAEIFNTERWDAISETDDTELQYAFAVDPGLYEVRLYLSNGFQGTGLTGQRVFDVAIEDQILPNLNNIDLAAQFGHLAGGMISNEVEVTDGTLNISFLHDLIDGIQNPLINGIEIIQVGDTTPPPTIAVKGEPYGVNEDSEFAIISFLSSEPVHSEGNVTVTFEIVPDSATPLEDYGYESSTAIFNSETGIYTDSITIPSGFSIASVGVNIFPDTLQETVEAFTVNVTDVDSNYQISSDSSTSIAIHDGSLWSTPIRMEAEDTLYSIFQNENNPFASGGQVLRLGGDDPNEVGNALFSFNDLTGFTPGVYNIVLGTYDQLLENGEPEKTFSFEVNGTSIGEISLRDIFISDPTVPTNAVERLIAEGVQLNSEDTLTVMGYERPGETFLLDYIQLNPVLTAELVF